MADRTFADTDGVFYAPPPTVRRRAFFAGRLQLAGIANLQERRERLLLKVKRNISPTEREDRRHGERFPSRQRKKLIADSGLYRISRKDRNRLLDRKCRLAGVRNAAGLYRCSA